MFKTAIEGECREHDDVESVIDHVSDKVYFEVDEEALKYDLEHMDMDESITLRGDCMISKIEGAI